tara:strand:- start:778 stop:1800 length:1023 start_codon:yes stop_codon:yes gene_type:complete
MKAIRIHSHGDADVLQIDNIPIPVCSSKKVLVEIKAAALNHLDIWVRNGLPGIEIPLPLIMGSDASGIVVEVGSKIKNFEIGDKVVVQPGTFSFDCKFVKKKVENFSPTYGIIGETENGVQAEYALFDEYNLHKMSSNLTFEESSSMQLVFMTAYQMLVTRANLLPDETVLIYGATSGIGSAAIQIAKQIGAVVISTVGNESKIDYARKMGSDHVLLHDNSLIDEVRQLNLSGIDVIFEHIGEKTWNKSMRLLSRGGRIVTCGSTTGSLAKFDLRYLFSKQQSILGSTMSDINTFKDVMRNIDNNIYKPFIDKVYNFNDIKIAHERMENRKNFGKIILIP